VTGAASFTKIPRRSLTTYRGELRDVLGALRRRDFARGGAVVDFERAFAAYVGAAGAAAAGSGRQALMMILEAAGVARGDRILFPAFTLRQLVDLTHARGLVPMFADVDPQTFHLTIPTIEQAGGADCRVIVATHLFGSMCDIGPIRRFCDERGIFLVEDCAQALGATSSGMPAGATGDAAFFSFSMDKPIFAFGGGMAVARAEALADKLRALAERLPTSAASVMSSLAFAAAESIASRPLFYSLLCATRGTAERMTSLFGTMRSAVSPAAPGFCDLQAIVAAKQLAALSAQNRHRVQNARTILATAGPGASPQVIPPAVDPIYYQLVFLVKAGASARDVAARLLARGVDAGVGEDILQFCPRGFDDGRAYPTAEEIVSRAIQIPNHARLSPSQVDTIAREFQRVTSE
jgi:dTDP-4-amino-4,6-dideoxygalactose transaminase